MTKQLTVVKLPSEELSYTNCAIVNAHDFDKATTKHVEIITGPSNKFLFTYRVDNSVAPGTVAFGALQRKWAMIGIDQKVSLTPFVFDLKNESVNIIILQVDFLSKKLRQPIRLVIEKCLGFGQYMIFSFKSSNSLDPYDTDKMAHDFLQQFNNQSFSVGQQLAFQLQDQKKSLLVTVKEIEGADVRAALEGRAAMHKKLKYGILLPNSTIVFEKFEGSSINLVGKSKSKVKNQSIINPDWDFNTMGIGGLDKEFNTIFRRAFASRVFPPEVIQQLGMKHVRGILLFGPPGTGKTLMARQIGKMLNAREPKIINGPQILDKYVGESEANIRKLFAEAEEEEKRLGPNSGLHIIIFDEIDAICKSRGSVTGASGVHDTVVNQLLAKIDGVEQLNNILIIGMTNRKDMIDEALMRPGRLEVQLEISLPDEYGRFQIINIHTSRMKEYGKLGADVDLSEIAALTKNFSGAEIEGLVRAAQSSAMNRSVKATNKVQVDENAAENLKVTRADFIYALENDIKPAFGVSLEEFETYIRNGIINWGQPVRDVLEEGNLRINQARKSEMTPLVSLLLEGKPNCGKTALAAKIAMNSEFPFIKFCTPQSMITYSETAKSLAIKKAFDDACKSEVSCLVVDDIESLLDYAPIGPRFSNLVLQTLKVLFKRQLPKGRKMLLIATTNEKELMRDLGLYQTFSKVVHVPNISRGTEIINVIDELNCFTKSEFEYLSKIMKTKSCSIGIKNLLDTVELAKQTTDSYRIAKFLSALEEEGGLHENDN